VLHNMVIVEKKIIECFRGMSFVLLVLMFVLSSLYSVLLYCFFKVK